MRHLGGADAVENLDARELLPAVEQGGRQDFAARDAEPQAMTGAAHALLSDLFFGDAQHAREQGRDADQDRRLIFEPLLPDHLRIDGSGIDDVLRAGTNRKIHLIAEAEGEVHFGRAQHDVVLVYRAGAAAEQLGRPVDVVAGMNHAFGAPGRARRVKPEGHVIWFRGIGIGRFRLRRERVIQEIEALHRLARDQQDGAASVIDRASKRSPARWYGRQSPRPPRCRRCNSGNPRP